MENNKPFEIIVLGPPVSGKGTQAGLLAKTFDIPHISAGQILHSMAKDAASELSQSIAAYMKQGQLVPDDLINNLIAERIKQADCRLGYILDGYPRTKEQAEFLTKQTDIDYVFLIQVNDAVIIERMSGRRVCKNSHTWHLKYSPSQKEGVCDFCHEPLLQRADDQEEVIKDRLAVYHQATDSLINFYQAQNKLIKIDGEKHIEEVFQQLVKALVWDLRSQIG